MAALFAVAKHVAITAASPRGFCCVNDVAFVDVAARRHIKASFVVLKNLPLRRFLFRHILAPLPTEIPPCLRRTQALLGYTE